MLGTDVIGWCLLGSLPFTLSSSVHGVSGQCLVRTSLVAAYGIRFPSSCLRLFMEFRGNAWYGRNWLLLMGFASLQVVFFCSWSFGPMLGTDVIGWCLLGSLPFKLSSSVHGVAGHCLVRTSLAGAYWNRFPSRCLLLFLEFRGNAWYGCHWRLLMGFASLQVVFVCSCNLGAMLGTDVIGCCLWDSLPFKLSSSVHGVSGQCLVRTSLTGAYWIRFPSRCLRLFMEFRAMLGMDVIGCILVAAYWIRFPSSCLLLFMEFQNHSSIPQPF